MIKTKWLITLIICLPIASLAKDGSYKECREIAKQIEILDAKRKRGGSGKKMDKWRKKRHQLSDEAYAMRCRKHGIIR